MVTVNYIGHASFSFKSEHGTTIYYDPWLDESPVASIKRSDIETADIVIATHGHNDHVRDAFEICHQTGAKFVGNYEMTLVAKAHGIEENQIFPMNPGGSVQIDDVQITMVQAFHNSGSLSPNLSLGPPPEGFYFRPDGGSTGIILSFDCGVTIYNTSDTNIFADMQLISQIYGPQIAILPIGGKFTMGIREGARAASLIRPDVVIPCHYGEAVGQPVDLDMFISGLNFLSPNIRVAALESGQSLQYTAARYSIMSARS